MNVKASQHGTLVQVQIPYKAHFISSFSMLGCQVCCSVCRYHLGSAAIGSFVVAIIQFVRFLLEYLDKKSKLAQAKAGVGGQFLKYCMCCIRCCMWYLEKIIKFINRSVRALQWAKWCCVVCN